MSQIRIIASTTALLISAAAFGQVREFPYEARVVAPDVYARSGGGEAFYPTQLLPEGSVVTVRRHDRGGWYMIDPPKGSFSWVPQKYVQQTGANTGVLRESNVVVFVGSSFGDETHVWQRKLSAGEEVKVIGQRMVDTLQGPKQMLKIHPPAREFRWILGSAVVPLDATKLQQRDNDPYLKPSEMITRSDNAPEQKPTPGVSPIGPSRRLTRLKSIREEQRKLYELDQKFRSMLLSDPSQWDLASIEQEYLKLQESITHKPIAGQIDLRYPAIHRYRTRKAEFVELEQITSATEKRDAELMASQYGIPPGNITNQENPGVVLTPPLTTAVAPSMFGDPTIASTSPSGQVFTPGPIVPTESNPSAPTTLETAGSGIANIPTNSQYIGAGYLQRGVGEEKSAYLLMSPAGKVLARVQKKDDTVDLEKFIGRAVGLKGSRWFDDREKSDYIEVSSLEEVRIRQ